MIKKPLIIYCFFSVFVYSQEIDFKKKYSTLLNPLINNTEGDEYSIMRMKSTHNKNLIEFIYVTSKKMKGEKLKNRIISNSTVYNLSKASIDTFSNKIVEDKLISSINTNLQEGPASYSIRDKKLFFTRSIDSMSSDKRYQLNIFQVSYPNSVSNAIPVPLFKIVGNYSNIHPYFFLEKNELYFSSDHPGGYGGFDIYKVYINKNGIASKPENLGPNVNSNLDEVFPSVYNENIFFYSVKNKKGVLDIFMANQQFGDWKIYKLKEPFLSESDDFGFSIDPKTNMGFLSSNRAGGLGKDDNYYFVLKPKLKGKDDNYFFDLDTLKIDRSGVLENDLELMKREAPLQQIFDRKVLLSETTKAGILKLKTDGTFTYKSIDPSVNKDSFKYKIVSNSYYSKPITVFLNRKKDSLSLIEKSSSVLRPVFFKFDNYKTWKIYKDRYDKIVKLLNEYTNLNLLIKSYADSRGSHSYNFKLSERRAISAQKYIESRLTIKNRIKFIPYGEETIETNIFKNYVLVVGVFKIKLNAKNQLKDLKKLGFHPSLYFDKNKNFRVIIKSFEYYFDALEEMQKLSKKGISSWIDKSPAIKVKESTHQNNRRVEFEIIN